MEDGSATFTAGVVLVFGVLAWAQFPALCGFMFTSTRAGPENYVYSMLLGAFIATIGLASAFRSVLRGPRRPLIFVGVAANAGFILFAALATKWYGESCHAFFQAF